MTHGSSLAVLATLAFAAQCGLACSGVGSSAAEPVGSSVAAESTECTGGPYVEGVDVYDGTGTIDWGSVKAAGIVFAIIKATQGNYDTQATFAGNWDGAKSAGVVRGAYHFFDPTIDGALQADYFLGVTGSVEPGDMPPMLDIECPDGDPNCMYPGGSGAEAASVIQARMNDWLTTVEAKTGLLPIVYSFESYFSNNGIATTGLQAYPLDIAYPTATDCFDVPSPWQSATFWQNSWTAAVNGISGAVDTDRFLGSPSQFQSFLVGAAPRGETSASDGGGEPAEAHGGDASSTLPGSEAPGLTDGSAGGDCGCRAGRKSDEGQSWFLWASGVGVTLLAVRIRRAAGPDSHPWGDSLRSG
jgi:GH25 family lysozyme M1 (1,4-beta-N-acetylmuramidase)